MQTLCRGVAVARLVRPEAPLSGPYGPVCPGCRSPAAPIHSKPGAGQRARAQIGHCHIGNALQATVEPTVSLAVAVPQREEARPHAVPEPPDGNYTSVSGMFPGDSFMALLKDWSDS